MDLDPIGLIWSFGIVFIGYGIVSMVYVVIYQKSVEKEGTAAKCALFNSWYIWVLGYFLPSAFILPKWSFVWTVFMLLITVKMTATYGVTGKLHITTEGDDEENRIFGYAFVILVYLGWTLMFLFMNTYLNLFEILGAK